MAKYTTQLRTYIESGGKVFDFDYPLFDPTYKSVLEQKILDYYYFREIGLETIAQFKWYLKSKMNRIMPYYNQLYEANVVFKTYDPYKNKNVTTTDTRTTSSDGNSSSTSGGNNSSTVKESDTPQAMLDGKDYATNVTETSATTGDNASGSSHVTTTDTYISTIAGHDGMKYPTDILVGLRNTFINIDQMIIEELADLFLNIY
jgi:hypothetical protein